MLGKVMPPDAPGHSLRLQMHPQDVHFFMAIMEGYAHLVFPVAVNPKAGLVTLHTTPGCFKDLQEIVANLPMPVMQQAGAKFRLTAAGLV